MCLCVTIQIYIYIYRQIIIHSYGLNRTCTVTTARSTESFGARKTVVLRCNKVLYRIVLRHVTHCANLFRGHVPVAPIPLLHDHLDANSCPGAPTCACANVPWFPVGRGSYSRVGGRSRSRTERPRVSTVYGVDNVRYEKRSTTISFVIIVVD